MFGSYFVQEIGFFFISAQCHSESFLPGFPPLNLPLIVFMVSFVCYLMVMADTLLKNTIVLLVEVKVCLLLRPGSSNQISHTATLIRIDILCCRTLLGQNIDCLNLITISIKTMFDRFVYHKGLVFSRSIGK